MGTYVTYTCWHKVGLFWRNMFANARPVLNLRPTTKPQSQGHGQLHVFEDQSQGKYSLPFHNLHWLISLCICYMLLHHCITLSVLLCQCRPNKATIPQHCLIADLLPRLSLFQCYRQWTAPLRQSVITFPVVTPIWNYTAWWQRQTRCNHSYAVTLSKPRCNSQARQRFLNIRVINLWNSLPADTTDFSSLRKFCSSITKDFLLNFCTVNFI